MAGPDNAARPLPVETGWARALEPVADRIHEMGDFLRAENAALATLPAAVGQHA